jgi:hypothetical protein
LNGPETFIPKASSNVESVTYDPDVENLGITVSGGRSYTYYNVPLSVYRGLTSASSAGQYVNRFIKQRYPYEEN